MLIPSLRCLFFQRSHLWLAALLKHSKVKIKRLFSPKTGKTYDGTVFLADTGGKYVNFRISTISAFIIFIFVHFRFFITIPPM